MTIIPDKPTALVARSDADFVQEFVIYEEDGETPKNLTGWTFRFVAKKSALDGSDWLVAQGVNIAVDAEEGTVKAFIERETIANAMPASAKQQEAVWALQATGPSDLDAVWAAGELTVIRGL